MYIRSKCSSAGGCRSTRNAYQFEIRINLERGKKLIDHNPRQKCISLISHFFVYGLPPAYSKRPLWQYFFGDIYRKKRKKNYWNFDSSSVFTFEIWSQIYDHPVDMIDYNYDSKNSQLLQINNYDLTRSDQPAGHIFVSKILEEKPKNQYFK